MQNEELFSCEGGSESDFWSISKSFSKYWILHISKNIMYHFVSVLGLF